VSRGPPAGGDSASSESGHDHRRVDRKTVRSSRYWGWRAAKSLDAGPRRFRRADRGSAQPSADGPRRSGRSPQRSRLARDRENAQDREQLRAPLDLVKDNEAAQTAQHQHGFIKEAEVLRILQIEGPYWTLPCPRDLPREGRLVHLARPEHGNHAMTREQAADRLDLCRTLDRPP